MSYRTFVRDFTAISILVATALDPARADEICHTVSVPLTKANFDVEIAVPRFDIALGNLQMVTVTIELQAIVAAGIENLEPTATVVTLTRGANGDAYATDNVSFGLATSSTITTHSLPAYDGVQDYGGTSGTSLGSASMPLVSITGSRSDSGALGLYAGPAGNPGTSGTRVRAVDIGVGVATGGGALGLDFDTSATFVSITVCYEFAPRVTSTCAGDGSATACPCSNSGAAGEGCMNSFGYGSLMTATGGAAVAADSLTLFATVPGTNAAMFFQGTALESGGAGVTFGDGLRCTDGTVIRLISTEAVSGIAQFPASGDPLVSVAGSVPSGATRYYQVWYRNSATYCTSDTFNLSNALQVDWGT